MRFRLVGSASPASAAAESAPASPLRPARDALQQHFASLGDLGKRLADLAQHQRDADSAQRDQVEADEALQAVAELEQGQWLDYIASGATGPAPEPLTELRAERAAAVAEAHARSELARRHFEAVRPLIDDLLRRHQKLAAQSPRLIEQALLESVEVIAQQQIHLARRANKLDALLNGISDSARFHNGNVISRVWAALATGHCGGDAVAGGKLRVEVNAERDAARKIGTGVIARLEAGDLAALDEMAEIDDGDDDGSAGPSAA